MARIPLRSQFHLSGGGINESEIRKMILELTHYRSHLNRDDIETVAKVLEDLLNERQG